MAEKHKLMTFEEWKTAIQNPPKSWTDYNMNWDDPNPQDSIYWMAIAEAIKERWYVVKYMGSGNELLDGMDYAISIKYQMALTSGFLTYIRDCIIELAKLYVDPTVTDYSWMFIKEKYDEFYSSYFFPAIVDAHKIYKKCPNMANLLDYKETDIQKAKILMKQFKLALSMLTQTPNGAIWGRRIGYDVDGNITYGETLTDVKSSMKQQEKNYRDWGSQSVYTGVRSYVYNGRAGYICFHDDQCFVGLIASEQRRDKYNDEVYQTYSYSGYLKFINDFAAWNPLGIKSKLKIYRYVSTNIAPPDDIEQDDEYYEGEYYPGGYKYKYEPYTFGLPEGFSIEDKGETPTTNPIQLDFVTVDDLPFFSESEIPPGDYGPSTRYPQNPFIYTYLIKGCKFLAVPIIDYGVEGGFKFK